MTNRGSILTALLVILSLASSASSQLLPLVGSGTATATQDNAEFLRSASQRAVLNTPADKAKANTAAIAKMQAATHYLNLGAPQAVPGWMQLHDSYSNQAMTARKVDVLFLGDSLAEVSGNRVSVNGVHA